MLSLERFGKGIDNAHVDVYLSPHLLARLRETVRKLLLEDLRVPASGRRSPEQLVGIGELEGFRESYLAMFRAVIERGRADASPDLPALFQVALVKSLLQTVAEEILRLREELKSAAHREDVLETGHSLEFHESLVKLTRGGSEVSRRILSLLFRQLRRLETEKLSELRASLVGDWPLPEGALFNPLLTFPDLGLFRELGQEYPAVLLAEDPDSARLFQTNQCISKVFQHFLPAWVQSRSDAVDDNGPYSKPQERLDQGQLRGFLETEILLRRFVSQEEYRPGLRSWIDEPENMRLFLGFADRMADPGLDSRVSPGRGYWEDARWSGFQRALTAELFLCLEMQGLARAVVLLYRLSAARTPSGDPLPFLPVLDYVEGHISRKRLMQRLQYKRVGLDQAAVSRLIDAIIEDVKRVSERDKSAYLHRYLVDFLRLRRDLKLAFKAYETMDAIRLVEDSAEVQLSRSNGTLVELTGREESGTASRRIIAHTVIKADVRGSTLITDQLRAKGLNPASYFSLNFFDPVNRLLREFGAEKLFVEGDAVILVIFEHEGDGPSLSVARACGLARKILQVVALQNVQNRKHGLPDLELGLGVAFSRGEPNFLYDEGRRIMISGAINRADRLCACASGLRRSGFEPEHQAFRVTVVSDARAGEQEQGYEDDDLLNYNVNGVKIEEDAFFKLQRELRLRQVRLPEEEVSDVLFFAASYPDLKGREHWLVLRYGAVRAWNGIELGKADARHRHFFEIIVDEGLTTRVRRLVRADA
jgi:hypothetical protein